MPQPPSGPVLAVQPVVPGLVPCAATPGRQPAAVLFTGSCPRVLAARGQGRAPSPAQVVSMPGCAGSGGGRGPKRSYCSAGCRVKAWRKRQRDAAEAQAHTETEDRSEPSVIRRTATDAGPSASRSRRHGGPYFDGRQYHLRNVAGPGRLTRAFCRMCHHASRDGSADHAPISLGHARTLSESPFRTVRAWPYRFFSRQPCVGVTLRSGDAAYGQVFGE